MKNNFGNYNLGNNPNIKQQILSWCNQFNICCFFNNNNYQNNYNNFEILAAVSNKNYATSIDNTSFEKLQQQIETQQNWLFGHINYDFKNELFPLTSSHYSGLQFPNYFLFEPEIVVKIIGNQLTIESLQNSCDAVFNTILNIDINTANNHQSKINILPKIAKEDYIKTIKQLQHHIQIGDCYEINFCQEFYAQNVIINPLNIYQKLNKISPTPFSIFYKLNDNYLLCASPERFIKKEGNKIISQPIKGTAKRNVDDKNVDDILKKELQNSQKEKSENIMIVDLVRNDLSKICNAGSVEVEELMKVYSFKQVHQMISTIIGDLKPNTNFSNVLKATFPMGSMTGAPKYKVMQLIEQYEKTKRNIYSGCVGYITPENDFDFNVVIRSITYNATKKYLNYQVGSAITHLSNAEDEYEECLLKAAAMETALK